MTEKHKIIMVEVKDKTFIYGDKKYTLTDRDVDFLNHLYSICSYQDFIKAATLYIGVKMGLMKPPKYIMKPFVPYAHSQE